MPPGPFDLIYVDPPWEYEFSRSKSRSIGAHYSTMDLEELCALPVAGLCAPEAALFLWVPSPLIRQGLKVLEAWGFEYREQLVSDKVRLGAGYWCRVRHELLLVGTRGKVKSPSPRRRPDSILVYPRTGHSAKPPEVRCVIACMVPWAKRRIELFARGRPPSGWVFRGDQAGTRTAARPPLRPA